MLLEPGHLLERFTLKTLPPFPCPRCGKTMVVMPESSKDGEAANSSKGYDSGTVEHEQRWGVFTVILKCSDSECSEHVGVVGVSRNEVEDNPRTGGETIVDSLEPRYFTPTINLFRIPDRCPKPIHDAVTASFAVFWSDPSAAGNALRSAVEALLDQLRVKKWERNQKGQKQRLRLHKRIEILRSKRPDWGAILMAIKWIGNTGSHERVLTKVDVMTGYGLLEFALVEIFEKRTTKIMDLANRINRLKRIDGLT